MASSNIARLGVVLGIDTASFRADVDAAIAANKKLKDSIERQSQAAAKEIAALTYATKDYGKEITKVEQIEREIATGRFQQAAPALKQELLARAAAYDAIATSSKKAIGEMTGQQRLQLSYQTTDLITQIASGQNAMIALLQQGGQLKDSMGGLGNMFRMLAIFVTPTNVAIAALATTVGAVGYAFYKGSQEASQFRDQMILTNQYANITLDGFHRLANTVSADLNVGLTNTKDVFMSLVSSGHFTEKSLGAVGTVIMNVSKLSGETASTVAGRLIPAFDGTASSAKRLNDQYHFLTLEQYKHIEALEKQGRFQESAKVTALALSDSLKGQERQLGYVEKAWNAVTDAARASWAAILNVGAEKGPEEKLTALRAALKNAQQDISTGLYPKVAEERAKRLQEQITKLESEIEAKKQKAIQTQKETEKIDLYAGAGGLGKNQALSDSLAKERLRNRIAEMKISETEIGRVELDVYQQVQEAKMDMERANTDERGVFAGARLKEYTQKVIAAEREGAEKIKAIRDKRFDENQKQRQEYMDQTDAEMAAVEDAENKALVAGMASIRLENESLRLEEEKYNYKIANLGATEKEIALAELQMNYDEKRRAIRDRSDLSATGKETMLSLLDDQQQLQASIIETAEQYKKLGDMYNSVTNNMSNAIETFVKTGKFSFKDFARSVIQDILAIQMKSQATQLFGSLGLFDIVKGVFGATSYVPANKTGMSLGELGLSGGRASGGSVSGGSTYLVGENGPELFTSSSSGTIIPNGQLGNAMSGGSTINYNGPYIANMSAIDTQSGVQFLSKNKQAIWAANQSASRSIPTSR